MAYEFTSDLETGNMLIDSQHRQLITAINQLLDACAKGQGRAEIGKTLHFLEEYIRRHFQDEEQLQQRFAYPDYPNHKQYHEGFKKSVSEILKEFDKDGATIPLVAKVNTVIASWLISHIKREDKKVAAHIQSKK